jgi:hypothetical protein
MWPRPLLGYVAQETWSEEYRPHLKGVEFMEANCAQCHTEENFAGTPVLNQGRKLYFASNCSGCHVSGLSDGTLDRLTDVGRKWRLDYQWVDRRPRPNLDQLHAEVQAERRPTKAIVVFLKSRRGMNFADNISRSIARCTRCRRWPGSLRKAAASGGTLEAGPDPRPPPPAQARRHRWGIAPDLI